MYPQSPVEGSKISSSKGKVCIIATIVISVVALIAASSLIGYYFNSKGVNNQSRPLHEGAVYNAGTKLKYFYTMRLQESLRLKSSSPNSTQSNDALVNVNVTVIVARNDLHNGGDLKLFIGLELDTQAESGKN